MAISTQLPFFGGEETLKKLFAMAGALLLFANGAMPALGVTEARGGDQPPSTTWPLTDADFSAEYGLADASDPFLYNVVVSGYHSANSADTEGGLAIGKDSTILPTQSGFNYGAFFDSDASGVGDPLTERMRVALMIGGEIKSYASQNSLPKIGNGLFIVPEHNKDALYSWPNIQGMAEGTPGHTRYLPDADFQQGMASMESVIQEFSSTLSSLSEETIAYDNGAHSVNDGIYQWPTYPKTTIVTRAANDPATLVIKVPADANGFTILPQINPYDLNITSDEIQRVIITTDAKQVAILGDVLGENGQPLFVNNAHNDPAVQAIVQALATKVVYNLPQTTEVSNLYWTNWQAIGPADLSNETGINADLSDPYSAEAFTAQQVQGRKTALVGALVAPLANVVWSGGSINGYVFAKNFHQRDSAEAHNFYYPHRPNIPSGGENHFGARLYKYVAGNKNSPLADAEFIFARKAKASGTYEYLQQTDGENWTAEAATATRFTTGADGWLSINALNKETSDLYEYYFKETKAPPGYQLNDQWIATSYDATSSIYTSQVENQEEQAQIPVRLALKKTDDANNLLEGAVFVLENEQVKLTATSKQQVISNIPELAHIKAAYAIFEENLAPGAYQLYEESPPTDFTFGKDGPTKDHPWQVTVSENNELIIKNGETILPYGKYLDPVAQINYGILTKAITNQPQKLDISIAKVDEEYHPLADVTFTLTGDDQIEATTDDKGLATFKGVLINHQYTLEETSGQVGTALWTGNYTLKLEGDQNNPTPVLMNEQGERLEQNKDYYWNARSHTLTFMVVNKLVPVMPATGGNGQLLSYLLGLVLLLSGFGVYKKIGGNER